MTIFEGLLMAHLLGDWLLQTEWQAVNKARHFGALLTHLVVSHAVIFAVLFWGFGLSLLPVVIVTVGLAVIHGILDGTGFLPWLMRTMRLFVKREPEKWIMVIFDQVIHLLLLGAATLVLTSWT